MKCFKLSNIKEIKTTVIGLIFLGAAILAVFKVEELNLWIFGILIVFGLLLLFSPNDVITILKNLIASVSKGQINKEE
jgi:uncharacterized membrane protein